MPRIGYPPYGNTHDTVPEIAFGRPVPSGSALRPGDDFRSKRSGRQSRSSPGSVRPRTGSGTDKKAVPFQERLGFSMRREGKMNLTLRYIL